MRALGLYSGEPKVSVFSKFITYCQGFLSLISCLANILISQLLHNYQIHALVVVNLLFCYHLQLRLP